MHVAADQRAVERCNECFLSEKQAPFTIVTHHRNTSCELSHDLCSFFESNRILYKLVDPINSEGFASPLKYPSIQLHGLAIEIKRVIELVQKGLLMSVVNKLRCFTCLKKSDRQVFCSACAPPTLKLT